MMDGAVLQDDVEGSLETCPHCFGSMDKMNFVHSDGVHICENCADGTAVWAALSEWRSSTSSQSFDLWMLESLGYEVNEDPDQAGIWLWIGNVLDGSDISFPTKEAAIFDAQQPILGNEPASCTNLVISKKMTQGTAQ